MPVDVVRPGPPRVENVVVPVDESLLAPQREQWAGDAAVEVGLVVLEVDARAGPVVVFPIMDNGGRTGLAIAMC